MPIIHGQPVTPKRGAPMGLVAGQGTNKANTQGKPVAIAPGQPVKVIKGQPV